jgi:hypothetical protein
MEDRTVVTVYKDTMPDRFTEAEILHDNLVEVSVPTDWFLRKISKYEMTMDFVENGSIADDFDWLAREAKQDEIEIVIVE